MPTAARKPSWDFLEQFRAPVQKAPSPSWEPAIALAAFARRGLEQEVAELDGLLARSDAMLEDLGGDPARHDWTAFRPLRLSREEDWSDWVGHLVQTSKTGGLASSLFGVDATLAAQPREMIREWTLPGGYRADLGISLRPDLWLHVEVKVGDLSMMKTFDTGIAMREELGAGVEVRDFMLLPEADVAHWDEVIAERRRKDAKRGVAPPEIVTITWNDVSKALRAELTSREESTTWLVWAYTFCGAIEQTLLGLPQVSSDQSVEPSKLPLGSLARYAQLAEVLRHGEDDDR